jgi:hypothetical protein
LLGSSNLGEKIMAQPNPTSYTDSAAVTLRTPEVPEASWDTGANLASCQAGVGINMGGGAIVGTPEQFTLEDQFEADRIPQNSSAIGGGGFVPRTGNQEFTWDKSQVLYTDGGAASSGGVELEDISGPLPVLVLANPDKTGVSDSDYQELPILVVGSANLESLAAGWIPVATP